MVVPPVVLLVPLFVFGVELGMISTFRLVILIYVGLMLPFSVYMLANFFRTIPASMIEAAIIDGASSWRVFRLIVLPLSAAPPRHACSREPAVGLERAPDRARLPAGRLEEVPIVALYSGSASSAPVSGAVKGDMADRLTIRGIETIPIRVPLTVHLQGQSTDAQPVHDRHPDPDREGIVGEAYNGDEDEPLQSEIGASLTTSSPPRDRARCVRDRARLGGDAPGDVRPAAAALYAMQAMACIDTAVWDAVGRHGPAAWRIWGGYRDRVPMIGIGGY